ncbi:MAG: hypothetical protein V3T86_04400 [Planctomycetota bacterium]
MTRFFVPALLVGLLVAAPAISQGDNTETAEQIAALMDQVTKLQKHADDQQKQIDAMLAYHQARKNHMNALVKSVDAAEKGGFTYPTPVPKVREAFLDGIRTFAKKGTENVPGEPQKKRPGR